MDEDKQEINSELDKQKELVYLNHETLYISDALLDLVGGYLGRRRGIIADNITMSAIVSGIAEFNRHIAVMLATLNIQVKEIITQEQLNQAREIITLENQYAKPNQRRKQTRSRKVKDGPGSTGGSSSLSSNPNLRSS